MPYGEALFEEHSNTRDMPYLFNSKERDEETGLYYYGARYLDPETAVWYGVDPLAMKYPDYSPYVYCANNPILFVDPDGKDWILRRTEDGVEEYYYDRSVTSQDEVNKKYGDDTGVLHISTGTKIRVYNNDGDEIQYTFINDAEKNKYGTVLDGDGKTMDNSQIIYGKHYTIFGTTDKSVNAETLHKNMFGSSYIGPNNPKDYRGRDSYQYQPTWSLTEMASYKHDLDYDALGSRGVGGVLSPKTKYADMQLIYECKQVLNNPNSSSQERSRARKIIAGFSIVNFVKPAAP
jgi:RHS repeat-associated protein